MLYERPVLSYPPECGGVDLSAHHVGQPEPDVVKQHDEDVGRIWGQATDFLATMMSRLGEREPGRAGRRGRREWENFSAVGFRIHHGINLYSGFAADGGPIVLGWCRIRFRRQKAYDRPKTTLTAR